MDNIELKMGKLFDSYNLRFEARDATAYNKGRNMIIFCLKPEVSVSPVYQNETKYGNRLEDCQSWNSFFRKA